jgi:hypothetical protein
VMCHLWVILDLDGQGIPINCHEVITQVLASGFKDELESQGQSVASPFVGLTCLDEDGDDIVISSNHEPGVAIHYAMRGASSAGASSPAICCRLRAHVVSHHALPQTAAYAAAIDARYNPPVLYSQWGRKCRRRAHPDPAAGRTKISLATLLCRALCRALQAPVCPAIISASMAKLPLVDNLTDNQQVTEGRQATFCGVAPDTRQHAW